MELITTLPSKERFHALIGPLVVAGDIVIVGGRGARGIRGVGIVELFQNDLSYGLAHSDTCRAKFALAEVIAPRVVMIVLDLALFEGEIAGVALVGEIMPIGMATASSIRTCVWHLVPEEAMMAGNSAPARCRDRTEVMGSLAVSGEVVVPRAIGAMLSLLEFVLGQCVVRGVLAVPRDSAVCSSSQSGVGSGYHVGVVWRGVAPILSMSPCQFASFFILFHQS
jgi:hypothetical protein